MNLRWKNSNQLIFKWMYQYLHLWKEISIWLLWETVLIFQWCYHCSKYVLQVYFESDFLTWGVQWEQPKEWGKISPWNKKSLWKLEIRVCIKLYLYLPGPQFPHKLDIWARTLPSLKNHREDQMVRLCEIVTMKHNANIFLSGWTWLCIWAKSHFE